MTFVPLFAPSLSAAEVVESVMLGVEEAWEAPVSWSWRGPVDLGIRFDL